MARPRLPELRTILVWGSLAFVAFAVGAVLFAWSGIYNVAASAGHLEMTRQFLEFGMRNSVKTHSYGVKAPNLDDPDLVRLGAGHYQTVCVDCHGGSGGRPSPSLKSMLPSPPALHDHIAKWSDGELFWIVKHGIKYAGMPAFPYRTRDDEIWAVVAFLRRLPQLDAAGYRSLALGNVDDADASPEAVVDGGSSEARAVACARCHGDETRRPTSALVPRLSGQSAAYLAASLQDYAEGRRESGIMAEIASLIADEEISSLAAYYSGLERRDPPETASTKAEVEAIKTGEEIAVNGTPSEGVPPCATCHGKVTSPEWPRLDGQSRIYLANQLRLWRTGHRRATANGKLMGGIAERMSEEQIANVSAYYASRPNPTTAGSDLR